MNLLHDYNIYCYVCTFILEFVLLYKCSESEWGNKSAVEPEEARVFSSEFCCASGW